MSEDKTKTGENTSGDKNNGPIRPEPTPGYVGFGVEKPEDEKSENTEEDKHE